MRKLLSLIAVSLISIPALSACAESYQAQSPALAASSSAGTILTDDSGMSLYTFDKDAEGVSNCYGGCAEKWPPFLADAGDAAENGYSKVTRTDGSLQWAYKGQPLYLWFKDEKAGDVSGDGVKGVWHLARP